MSDILHGIWFAALLLTPCATVLGLLVHLHSPSAGRQADLIAFAMGIWCVFFPIGRALAPLPPGAFVGPDEILGGGGLLVVGGCVGIPCALIAALARAISTSRERLDDDVIS